MRAPTDNRPNQPSSYPDFDPHITLASVPMSSPSSLLSIRVAIPIFESPLTVDFKSIEIGTHFFRSVYLAIAPTPALSALHEQIHAKLGIEPRTPSFPHLSLSYISDEDAQSGERESYLQALENAGRIDRDGKTVALDCGNDGTPNWIKGFRATEIWVADCDGPVEGWTVLDKIAIMKDV